MAHVRPLVNQSGALLPRENHPNTAAGVFVERNWCDGGKHTNAHHLHVRAPSGVDVMHKCGWQAAEAKPLQRSPGSAVSWLFAASVSP